MLEKIEIKQSQPYCHQFINDGVCRMLPFRLVACLLLVIAIFCFFTSTFTILFLEAKVAIYFNLLTGQAAALMVIGTMFALTIFLMCAKKPNQILFWVLKKLEKTIYDTFTYVFRITAMPEAVKFSDLAQYHSSRILPAPYTPPRFFLS